MEVTILTDIKPENPAFYEEFFGPVALFFKVKNEEEAIAFANDSPFGFGGSVFTQDIERGKRVANQIDTEWFLSIIALGHKPIYLLEEQKVLVMEEKWLS